MSAELSRIFVYPVKSLAGIECSARAVTRRGLSGDRRFVVVDPEGRFVTQRELHAMATVRTALEDDWLVLRAPEGAPLRVPLSPQEGQARRVQVWDDEVDGLDAGPDAARFLQNALGRPLRLVYMPETSLRPVSPHHGAPGDHVSFADGFPFLLLSEASHADLDARMGAPVPVQRFRPNLVLRGVPAYAEDTWARITLGGLPFRVVKPCSRCVITTLDPHTGRPEAPSPLKALARYRRADGQVYFAQNALVDADAGTLAVGAPLQVREVRTAPRFDSPP